MSACSGIFEAVPGYPFAVKMTAALPPDLSAPAHARSLVRAWLADWGLADQIDDAELVVSELVANAVRHGSTPLRLTVGSTDGNVVICVEDASPGRVPVPRTASESDSGGRGMQMISAVSQRWGCTSHSHTKIVWAELSAH